MDAEIKPRKLRILSGPVAEVELELNLMLEDYGVIMWSFHECGGVAWANVVLLSMAEMRMAAFLQAGQMRRN